MEERWGLFLKHLDFTDPDDAKVKFSHFLEEIKKEYAELEDLNKIIQNPTYYIRYANSLIEHADSYLTYLNFNKDDYYQKAINTYSKAISLDPNNCYIGYNQRAYAFIKKGDDDYKNKALNDLIQAKDIIHNQAIPQLLSLQVMNREKANTLTSDFCSQISYQMNILKSFFDNISQSISIIEKSQQFIEIHDQNNSFTKLDLKQALKILSDLYTPISLKFHDLKAHSDITTQYQAKNTIDSALQKYPDLPGIDISFENLSRDRAINILPEFKDPREDQKRVEVDQENQEIKVKKQMSQKENEGLHYNKQKKNRNFVDGTYVNATKKVKKLTNWYYEFEKSKNIPTSLILDTVSYDNSIKLLEQLSLTNEVKVNFTNVGTEYNISTYSSPTDAMAFINQVRNNLIKKRKSDFNDADNLNITENGLEDIEDNEINGLGIELTIKNYLSKKQKN